MENRISQEYKITKELIKNSNKDAKKAVILELNKKFNDFINDKYPVKVKEIEYDITLLKRELYVFNLEELNNFTNTIIENYKKGLMLKNSLNED